MLCGAVGLVAVAPAAAEPGATAAAPGAGAGASRTEHHSNVTRRSRDTRNHATGGATDGPSHRRGYPGRASVPEPPGGTRHETTEPHEWRRPCHFIWPVWPVRPTHRPFYGAGNNSGIRGVPSTAAQLPPLAQFPASVAPTLPGFGIEPPASPPDSDSGPNQALSAAASNRSERSGAPTAPPPPAVPLAGAKPPTAPAPQRPDTGAGLPEGGRLGYPEYLRNAAFAEVAMVALLGLAGIAGITTLGGFLGYRQAKTGYVLRAAGTARFLQ